MAQHGVCVGDAWSQASGRMQVEKRARYVCGVLGNFGLKIKRPLRPW